MSLFYWARFFRHVSGLSPAVATHPKKPTKKPPPLLHLPKKNTAREMERHSARMKDQDPVAADDDGVHRSSSIIIDVDGGAPVLQSMHAQVYAFDSCSVRMRKRSIIFYTVTGLSLSNRLIVEYQFCANCKWNCAMRITASVNQ